MKQNIILILKGFIVGLGKIIPGVSGALLAISMGIYDAALEAISHFFKDIKKHAKFLFPIGIGLILAIVFCSNIIAYFINKHYVITMLLFLGLIVGGIPSLLKTCKEAKINRKDYVLLFIVLLIGIIFQFTIKNTGLSMNKILNYPVLYWLIIGCIDAITMIIPGISGTAIFVMLGCYNNLINMYADPINHLAAFIPFFLGLGITVLALTKIITWLFKNCQKGMYILVVLLLFISLIALITNILSQSITVTLLILGIILFIIGFIAAYKLER